MTDHTPLTHCLVLVNEWAALRGVALKASLVSAQENKATGFKPLLNVCLRTFDSNSGVRVMTIGTADFAFQNRVVVRQLELRPHFQVTLETSLRRLPRIDNSVRRASALNVKTPRTVTRLTTNVLRVLAFCLEPRMRRSAKVAHDVFVAGLTFFGANELGAGNARRSKNCSIGGAAGKQNYRQRGSSSGTP